MLNAGAQLSEEPVVAASLERSLGLFLADMAAGRFSERTVEPTERERNSFYFDGIAGLPRTNDGVRHPPALLKAYTFDGASHLLTLAFRMERDDQTALHKVVEVKAVPHGDGHRFESPYDERTRDLARTTIGDVTFGHRGPLDRARAEDFVALKGRLEELTGAAPMPLTYDCFGSLDALLKAYGFVFDASRCNFLAHDLGFEDDSGRRFVTGTGDPNYAFAFVSSFLRRRSPTPERLYGAALVGLATNFGGYGLSRDGLPTLKAQFRAELLRRPDLDFLAEYRKGRASSIERHFVHYVICAFFMEEALESGGFEMAWELLHTGAGGEDFMATLARTLGVGEANFHGAVVRMIGA